MDPHDQRHWIELGVGVTFYLVCLGKVRFKVGGFIMSLRLSSKYQMAGLSPCTPLATQIMCLRGTDPLLLTPDWVLSVRRNNYSSNKCVTIPRYRQIKLASDRFCFREPEQCHRHPPNSHVLVPLVPCYEWPWDPVWADLEKSSWLISSEIFFIMGRQ